MEKCIYCGKNASYQFKNGKWCCSKYASRCDVQRTKNENKAKKIWKEGLRKSYNLLKDTQIDGITKCEYGCGEIARFKTKQGKLICCKSPNSCKKNKEKNSASVRSAYENNKILPNRKPKILTPESRRRMCWNKGLTKETNESLMKLSLSFSGRPGHTHTPETRKHLSEKRMEYLENNHHLLWFSFNNGKKNIKVQGNWERKFAEFLISQHILWERNRIIYQETRTYTPDFYLPEYNIYVEIKGWMKEYDKYKMWLVLNEKYIDLRIVSSLKIIDDLESKKILVNELPKFSDNYPINSIDYSKFNINNFKK